MATLKHERRTRKYRAMLRGVCIPGLSVAAREFPTMTGVKTLENPEVGCGEWLERDYTLEEVAEMHVAKLASISKEGAFTLCGYSMGGMILSIMATQFRSKLPRRTQFIFLMTSPNFLEPAPILGTNKGPRAPAIKHGTEEEYALALAPYFSESFLARHPRRFAAYVRYRTLGLNGQTPQGLFRQLFAMQRCRAHEYISRLDPREATFIGSRADRIFGAEDNAALARLCPGANHVELEQVGHMIHHEQPSLIRGLFDADEAQAPLRAPLSEAA